MKNKAVLFGVPLVLALCATLPLPAMSDASHARIVRLSLRQGEVRYTTEFHKDSMSDSKASWEVAPLNLPIRQGYAIGTDNNGRAEIEFENGAMAFLNANSVVEFYDLSLQDGARITRLILRQGTAEFSVHPENGDYFSVTGGDFSVEADGRSRFRVDNFDDGSSVNVQQGRVAVLRQKETKELNKGQMYSVSLNDRGATPVVGSAGAGDDFDKWVSSRIDTVATASTYANQYVNSVDYTAGLADLYMYGSWYGVAGYGYGWQPFGVGLGWCPFNYGFWNYDPFFGGWGFIGSAPWGWLPYHYGGWVFNPIYGWLWVPSGFGFGGFMPYRPVTAVWVHSGAGGTGLVPLHPMDTKNSRTPVNISRGVYPIQNNTVVRNLGTTGGEKWSTMKTPPRTALNNMTTTTAQTPTRVSRTIVARTSGGQPVVLSRGPVVYDASQHRYVNGNSTRPTTNVARANRASVPSRSNTPARPSMSPARPSGSYSGGTHGASGGSHGSWGGAGGRSSAGPSSAPAPSSSGSRSGGGGSPRH